MENVCKISNWIMRTYPGGWDNVAKLSLYSSGVLPLVVYFSQGNFPFPQILSSLCTILSITYNL